MLSLGIFTEITGVTVVVMVVVVIVVKCEDNIHTK